MRGISVRARSGAAAGGVIVLGGGKQRAVRSSTVTYRASRHHGPTGPLPRRRTSPAGRTSRDAPQTTDNPRAAPRLRPGGRARGPAWTEPAPGGAVSVLVSADAPDGAGRWPVRQAGG